MDFIFGSFAEWTGVLDDRPESTHCTLSPAEWKLAFNAAGYSDALFLTSSGSSVAHMAIFSQGILSPAEEGYTSPASTPMSNSIPSLLSNSKVVDIAPPMQLVDTELNGDLTVVRCFSAGGETDLVRFLSSLDSARPHVVWLYTNTEEGNNTLIGLVRSIRHEFSLWKVMMVLFHPSWDQDQQQSFIYRRLMSLKWVDAEVMIDEKGEIRVPRVVTAPAPPRIEAREDKPIEFNESCIWRAFPAPLGPEDVEVTVAFISLSPTFADCSEFSGTVTAVGSNVSSDGLLGER
jgi:fatty acid synthase, animal type